MNISKVAAVYRLEIENWRKQTNVMFDGPFKLQLCDYEVSQPIADVGIVPRQ